MRFILFFELFVSNFFGKGYFYGPSQISSLFLLLSLALFPIVQERDEVIKQTKETNVTARKNSHFQFFRLFGFALGIQALDSESFYNFVSLSGHRPTWRNRAK